MKAMVLESGAEGQGSCGNTLPSVAETEVRFLFAFLFSRKNTK
jgi:hypothetical protein